MMQNPPPPPLFAADMNNNTIMNEDATNNLAQWRERERRQRSVRVLMTFLLMLLLLDEETPESRQQRLRLRRQQQQQLNMNAAAATTLEPSVYAARVQQDTVLQQTTQRHERYLDLIRKNGGTDVAAEITAHAESVQDEFALFDSAMILNSNHNKEQDSYEKKKKNDEKDPERNKKVFHYPWNATGFYRGDWKRVTTNKTSTTSSSSRSLEGIKERKAKNTIEVEQQKSAVELQDELLLRLRKEHELARVVLLSDNKIIQMRNDNNLTSTRYDDIRIDGNGKPKKQQLPTTSATQQQHILALQQQQQQGTTTTTTTTSSITLTRHDGRAAFQLFGRSVPGMRELSLVDGFLKLYDSTSPGYSTRKDVLLRLRGVLLHSIGKLSLVSTTTTTTTSGSSKNSASSSSIQQCALVLDPEYDGTTSKKSSIAAAAAHRRLEQAMQDASTTTEIDTPQLVADAWELYDATAGRRRLLLTSQHEEEEQEEDLDSIMRTMAENDDGAKEEEEDDDDDDDDREELDATPPAARLHHHHGEEKKTAGSTATQDTRNTIVTETRNIASDGGDKNKKEGAKATTTAVPPWSNIVLPYPFVRDDKTETIRKARTPAARLMPPREQSLEANAAACGFEVNMDIGTVEWTVGEWRKLVSRRVEELQKLDPASQQPKEPEDDEVGTETDKASAVATKRTAPVATSAFGSGSAGRIRRTKTSSSTSSLSHSGSNKPIQDQALVMSMVGTIHSANCNFTAILNTTALRTDWDATTSKAINYSFYMMLVCLTQILILLRQLLHSQSQSTATRVSLLCIGWQTVIDALSCLAHIYLSLAVQPLFTAFASVAFFKLLIFCVIEMKYMAIIIQARNSSNGGQPTDVLRRQVAMLHLRFYVALLVTFLLMFYVTDKYRLYYMLLLYSFWVPQIVMNIITEAKTPMHKYFIYGMSITRVVAPAYVFALPNNFLKEVYPEAPSDPSMCQWLILWVACQTAVLIAQSKYGARFMIPARFLPPKFDYSRPLPPSMLPPGAFDLPTPECMDEREDMLRSPNSPKPQEKQSSSLEPRLSTTPPSRHQTAETTRNRHKGSRLNHQTSSMTTEDHTLQPPSTAAPAAVVPTLECSICYDDIDVRDRHKYMLAPCNHLFHRECLAQWMDVKMECPICRTDLPAL